MAKYVRNKRPNVVHIRVENLKISLGRRGTREDTIAVPDSAYENRAFKRNLTNGLLEEITEEQFFNLNTRELDEDESTISHANNLEQRGNETLFTLENAPNRVHIIKEFEQNASPEDKARGRKMMTPVLEYITPPPSTEEELAAKEEADRPAPKRRGRPRKTPVAE